MKIDVTGISKVFKSKRGVVTAVEDLSFFCPKGEFLSIIGPSGCGKTTLLKIIGGLLEPTTGEVLIDQRSPNKALSQRKIGFVFQNPTLLKWRTARQNVSLLAEVVKEDNKSGPSNFSTSLAEKLLDLVGLKGFSDSYPRELSGGMQQRVALARALAFNPEILLMDEPLGALDGLTRQKMQMVILRLWEETKKTILFVTHDIHEAIFVGDRVLVLSERPAKVVADIPIQLRRPRERNLKLTNEFLQYEETLWRHLRET